ncbi:hypothetical protein CCP3SC1AL1_3360003 [Gammaproteobacteria bacterium]
MVFLVCFESSGKPKCENMKNLRKIFTDLAIVENVIKDWLLLSGFPLTIGVNIPPVRKPVFAHFRPCFALFAALDTITFYYG